MKIIIRVISIAATVACAGFFTNCAPETKHRHVHHYYDESPYFHGEQGVQSSGGGAEGFEPVSSY